MNNEIKAVRVGLFLVILTLIFGLGMGFIFGLAGDAIRSYISEGVAAHASVHDSESIRTIWRYATRAHFHATGVAAFSFGLVILIMFSSLQRKLKSISSILIGLSGFYPLAWFSMFILAPTMGIDAAHHHIITKLFTYVGIGSLTLGIAILCINLFLDKGKGI